MSNERTMDKFKKLFFKTTHISIRYHQIFIMQIKKKDQVSPEPDFSIQNKTKTSLKNWGPFLFKIVFKLPICGGGGCCNAGFYGTEYDDAFFPMHPPVNQENYNDKSPKYLKKKLQQELH